MNDEQNLFRETVTKFFTTEAQIGETRKFLDHPAGFTKAFWKAAGDLGCFSLLVDEEFGGAGLGAKGLSFLSYVATSMGRFMAPSPILSHSIVASAVSASGSDTLKKSLLPKLASGDVVATWCFAEASSGFAPDSMLLSIDKEAGGYKVSGTKVLVESGADADYFLVTGRCDGELAQVVIPSTSPGISITRLESMDVFRRFATVKFDNVQAEDFTFLKAGHKSADEINRQIHIALALQSAESAGAIERVLEFTLDWMFDRHSFGRPLASYQALKHRYADLKTWGEACSATAASAIEALSTDDAEAGFLAWVAKAYLNDRAAEIVQDCVQIHGGIGVTWDHDIHLFLRRVSSNQHLFGARSEAFEKVASFVTAMEAESA